MKRKIYKVLIITLVIILLSYIYYHYLFKNGIVIPCIFHKITNLYCPGCGVTRMILSLIKLDFYQAFRYNSLITIFVPFILFLLIDFIIKWITGNKNYFYIKIPNKIWIVLLIITISFGVIRNIPYFDYFIPTVI